MKRYRIASLVAAMLALALALPVQAAPISAQAAPISAQSHLYQRRTLENYAADTWQSFVAMTDEDTGLPADNLSAGGERSEYTSPTNIGAYIWSTLVARDLKLISRREEYRRIRQTLDTVAELERHEPSGQFFNWYHPATGERLTTWPVDGNPVYPFLSSVDNGWLASALIMVTHAVPRLRDQAAELVDDMDFGFYYDPEVGQIRGGYWTELPPNQTYAPQASGGCETSPEEGDTGAGFTCHHYGALNTEPRIASYIGIAMGDIPPEHYFKMWRTFPDTCDWSWQEMKPGGEWRNYLGVDVFEGHYTYRGMDFVPTWGGSMFEALMVPLLVPEETWGRRSWGVTHPLYVRGQIEHGLDEADYGYWGFSPSNNPAGGYREYGVDALGLEPNGYFSDQERTPVDYGFEGCEGREEQSIPQEYGDGVVTPHASFLALDYEADAALANLAKLRRDFDIYGEYGFYDAVNVATGEVSQYYLALDQGMIMFALGNELLNNKPQRYFTRGDVRRAVRPLLRMEEFTAGSHR